MLNLKIELKKYLDNNLINENTHSTRIFNNFKYMSLEESCNDNLDNVFLSHEIPKSRESTNENIKDFIDKYEQYNDFQTLLFKLIDDRELKDSDVYNKVHIDRRLFSKIRSDKNYHPSKETIILLGIALELTENELDELLDSASYSLPKNNEYDLIIRFCFINKIFNIININELLSEYNCKLFNY